MKLCLFSFSLLEKEKSCKYLPSGSITTWDSLAEKFLGRYFPPGHTEKLVNEIFSFYQADGESLYEA